VIRQGEFRNLCRSNASLRKTASFLLEISWGGGKLTGGNNGGGVLIFVFTTGGPLGSPLPLPLPVIAGANKLKITNKKNFGK
jgi:hypothetical protein